MNAHYIQKVLLPGLNGTQIKYICYLNLLTQDIFFSVLYEKCVF